MGSASDWRNWRRGLLGMTLVALGVGGVGGSPAFADDASKKEQEEDSVTREEFDKLKERVDKMTFGKNNFMLTGYALFRYRDREDSQSQFRGTHFNPIFLWKKDESLFFEGELEIEVEDDTSMLDLEYASMYYVLNDYMTFGAGKFLTPFGIFRERLHPAWINKVADRPLLWDDNMLRLKGEYGVQLRGGTALTPQKFRWGPSEGPTKFNYVFYVTNGPQLDTAAATAGRLTMNNSDDNNQNKAFGGRIGLLPFPELELGISFMEAAVGDRRTAYRNVDASLRGYDLSYVRDSDLLMGSVDLRYEWAEADVDRVGNNGVGYGTAGGDFANKRDAVYYQAAYRPSKVDVAIVKNLEGVVRIDSRDLPAGAPQTVKDRKTRTLGLNYWLRPDVVVKFSYLTDDKQGPDTGATKDQDQFLVEFAMAF